MEELKILELFSGIGGMHYAFKNSKIPGKILAAVDINPIANNVYKHNHPFIQVLNNNIQKLTPKYLKRININPNMILMSPPCQPFTRVGKKKGLEDNRSDAFKYICELIQNLPSVDYILMENVKGFEISEARNLYIRSLNSAGYYYREFILSPSQFGIPNTRHRYFCLARKSKDFDFIGNKIWNELPIDKQANKQKKKIEDILELDFSDHLFLSDDTLKKRLLLMDIVTGEDINSCCFTKAYTHYAEGTGSIFSPCNKIEMEGIFNKLNSINKEDLEYVKLLKQLGLRYFTPKEVSRLMNFPDEFKFPMEVTNRQKYRLLGNSVNVFVVSKLLTLLCL